MAIFEKNISVPEKNIFENIDPFNPKDLERLDELFKDTFLESDMLRFYANSCKNINFWLK